MGIAVLPHTSASHKLGLAFFSYIMGSKHFKGKKLFYRHTLYKIIRYRSSYDRKNLNSLMNVWGPKPYSA